MWLRCDCGAEDCPSCGPAQGFKVVRVWSASRQRWIWVNPDPDAEDEPVAADDYPAPDDYFPETT